MDKINEKYYAVVMLLSSTTLTIQSIVTNIGGSFWNVLRKNLLPEYEGDAEMSLFGSVHSYIVPSDMECKSNKYFSLTRN